MEHNQFLHDLHTVYASALRRPFLQAVRQYGMITAGDHIAVCLSGGKDSALLALLLTDLQRYGNIPFSLTVLTMDGGFAPENRANLEHNARLLGLSPVIFETDVLRVVQNHAGEHPCFLCAKMRRGHLYAQAQALGCNKIALGHHYDDAVETVLMGMLYGGQVQAMLPRVQSKNYAGMELIRPLYLVREQVVTQWQVDNGLTFLPCNCPARHEQASNKRGEIKALIATLEVQNPQVPANILNAVKNVDTQKLLGWRTGAEKHSFLDAFL